MTTGILLINLGTPDEPTVPAIRRYLRGFLMDGRVIDIPLPLRAALVHLYIAPTRPAKLVPAYKEIWSQDGSPLLAHSRALTERVSEHLGADFKVALGMRYGNPSLIEAFDSLSDCERVIAVPLYPQYASASTGTALEVLYQHASAGLVTPHLTAVPPFYAHPAFIDAAVSVTRPHITPDDFVLFSYHALPVRHLPCEPCAPDVECPAPQGDRSACYRAQCYATTRAMAARLGLPPERYTSSFQSRLGRTPWIRPYTDELVDKLAKEDGIKRLVVVSPSFVADCLETLEEIGIRLREQFLEAGGEHFVQVPCVNSAPEWVDGVVQLIQEVGGTGEGRIAHVVSPM